MYDPGLDVLPRPDIEGRTPLLYGHGEIPRIIEQDASAQVRQMSAVELSYDLVE